MALPREYVSSKSASINDTLSLSFSGPRKKLWFFRAKLSYTVTDSTSGLSIMRRQSSVPMYPAPPVIKIFMLLFFHQLGMEAAFGFVHAEPPRLSRISRHHFARARLTSNAHVSRVVQWVRGQPVLGNVRVHFPPRPLQHGVVAHCPKSRFSVGLQGFSVGILVRAHPVYPHVVLSQQLLGRFHFIDVATPVRIRGEQHVSIRVFLLAH